MPEFICTLKKYRLIKELTQEQLADKVGVRRETIMRLEAGKYNPSLKLAIDISRAVEVPIEELFLSIKLFLEIMRDLSGCIRYIKYRGLKKVKGGSK